VLILVRHGRTAANAAGLLQGRRDNPLDPVGEAQALAIARALGPVDRVITSPLQRARSTAAAISEDLVVDDRWVELDYGVFDGKAQGDLAADVWDHWRADPEYAPPGGESLADLDRRVAAALDELAQDAQRSDVVVVSHVSPIKAAIAWSVGSSVGVMSWRCRLDVASICRIAVTPRGPVMISFNETAHLAG
jgi:broad specificity phosphatase PhoE